MIYEKQVNLITKISKRFIGDDNIKIIFEIGARDGSETLALNSFFPRAVTYSFECNPATISTWKSKVKNIKNVICKELAISDKKGLIDFYQIDQDKTETTWSDGNPGASSLLQSSGKYEVEKYVQNKLEVMSDRIDNIMTDENINSVDIVWMDIQGAELMALKGAGDKIRNVKIIHTEVEFFEIYKDQPLFFEIKKYLNSKGFLLGYFTSFGKYSGDAVFLNEDILKNNLIQYYFFLLKNIFLYRIKYFVLNLKKILKLLKSV